MLGQATPAYSQDRARQRRIDHRTLYVLGFGTAGAIVANALILAYFFS